MFKCKIRCSVLNCDCLSVGYVKFRPNTPSNPARKLLTGSSNFRPERGEWINMTSRQRQPKVQLSLKQNPSNSFDIGRSGRHIRTHPLWVPRERCRSNLIDSKIEVIFDLVPRSQTVFSQSQPSIDYKARQNQYRI